MIRPKYTLLEMAILTEGATLRERTPHAVQVDNLVFVRYGNQYEPVIRREKIIHEFRNMMHPSNSAEMQAILGYIIINLGLECDLAKEMAEWIIK